MTSRQRNSSSFPASSTPSLSSERPDRSRRRERDGKRRGASRSSRRQHLLEKLESRQLLAGPQLIGVQPNAGELIDNGDVRQIAPRVLTFRFDEDQQIDANTLGAIQITRSGRDGTFGTTDDVRIQPGLVTLGDPNENEVIVRFADTLPDDNYRINVYGYDDPNASPRVVGLRNMQGELIQPSVPGTRTETIDFKLDLGALVESIVPQPVIRGADGTLTQNRDEVVVYFNEDPLFTENGPDGKPTARSAENPRFYQLLLTQDTVRTTDDIFYQPKQVIYDANTFTARLIFDTDINSLPGVPVGGGTFRLRVGTAVDSRADLIVPPTQFVTAPSATVALNSSNASFDFVSRSVGENASGQQIRFVNTGAAGLSVSRTSDGVIVFNYGGTAPVVSQLVSAIAADPVIRNLISISVNSSAAALPLPQSLVGGDPVTLTGLGDTLGTSLDIGTFGQSGTLTSLVIRDSISPKNLSIELPGGDSDPGHRLLIEHINGAFGPDTQAGISEIPYNFKGVYFQNGSTSSLNQITPTQKQRIREVLELWSHKIGVQFTETADQGITFALGETSIALTSPALPANIRFTAVPQLQASVRVDPAVNDNTTASTANASIVFSNQANFGLSYGEDFTRKAAAGVGFLLGLLAAPDLAPQVLMSLNAFNEEALLRRSSDGGRGTQILPPTTSPNSPNYQVFDERFPEFRGFLNDPIDPIVLPTQVPTTEGSLVFLPDNIDDFQLPNWEPVFPSNVDVLHGQYVSRPDSVDVDLYRFEVNLGDADRLGQLSVETYAERLADSSSLDTTLTLFQEVRAGATSDLKAGPSLQVQFDAVQLGASGNGARIEFIESDRGAGDSAVRVTQLLDNNGTAIGNGVVVDLPRRGRFITSVPVSDVINAIKSNPLANSLFNVTLVKGSPSTDISGQNLRANAIVLSGGGLEQLSRNDDYFSEDSFLNASLGAGVYYIGVAASGNDTYDPMIKDSGFGGLTQGDYELRIKFEPQVDEVDVIRDRDGSRAGVPGTPIDGDGDGAPRGVNNFWFQTRPELRTLNFTLDGEAIVARQTVTITGADGDFRTYEFIPIGGGAARPGNIAVSYSNTPGNDSPAANLAEALATAINGRQDTTGVTAIASGDQITLDGERALKFSSDFRGVETFGRMIFVDKMAATNADGSLEAPFNNINYPVRR